MKSSTQTTPNGSVINGIHWNHQFGRQEGIATLKTGEKIKVWRGGWEDWGKGWIPLDTPSGQTECSPNMKIPGYIAGQTECSPNMKIPGYIAGRVLTND